MIGGMAGRQGSTIPKAFNGSGCFARQPGGNRYAYILLRANGSGLSTRNSNSPVSPIRSTSLKLISFHPCTAPPSTATISSFDLQPGNGCQAVSSTNLLLGDHLDACDEHDPIGSQRKQEIGQGACGGNRNSLYNRLAIKGVFPGPGGTGASRSSSIFHVTTKGKAATTLLSALTVKPF